jgi:hypothetical protein
VEFAQADRLEQGAGHGKSSYSSESKGGGNSGCSIQGGAQDTRAGQSHKRRARVKYDSDPRLVYTPSSGSGKLTATMILRLPSELIEQLKTQGKLVVAGSKVTYKP